MASALEGASVTVNARGMSLHLMKIQDERTIACFQLNNTTGSTLIGTIAVYQIY